MEDFDCYFKPFVKERAEAFVKAMGRASTRNIYSKYKVDHPGFPIYMNRDDSYYTQRFFDRQMEYNIREHLINPIFYEAFDLIGVNVEYPKRRIIRASNISKESADPFEFILTFKDGERVGIKYVNDDYDYIEECLDDYDVDKAIIINWEDVNSERYKRQGERARENENPRIREMSVEEFFKEFFSQDDYEYFSAVVAEAVEEAESLIGYKTIQPLSMKNLTSFRADVSNALTTFDYQGSSYHMFEPCDENGNKKPFAIVDGYMFGDEYEALYENFINKEKYKALIGKSAFANSFITAEYLYNIFKNGNHLDYTAVVCGYIKAVEQLLHCITRIAMNYRADEGLDIDQKTLRGKEFKEVKKVAGRKQKLDKNGKPINRYTVPLKPENEKYFDITMGSLCIFLNSTEKNWLISSKLDVEHRKALLGCYRSECRNEHFHKDNISEYDIVEYIRKNTYLIMFLLIGGCRLTEALDCDLKELDVIDETFTKLYLKMQDVPQSQQRFKITLQDNTTIKCIRLWDQALPKYDKYGTLDQSEIVFAIVDDYAQAADMYDKALTEEETYILTCKNIPNAIDCVLRNGKELSIYPGE